MPTSFNNIAHDRVDQMLSIALLAQAKRTTHSHSHSDHDQTIAMISIIEDITGVTKAYAIETLGTYTFHKAD